jgi:hypothetical protein
MSSDGSNSDTAGNTPRPGGGKKRRATAEKAAASSAPPWMAEFKKEWKKEIKKDRNDILAEFKKVSKDVGKVAERVESVEKNHNDLEQQVCAMGIVVAQHSALLNESTNKHIETKQQLERNFANMAQRVAAAESAPPPKSSDAFDRDAEPWRLKVSAQSRFAKESLTKLVEQLSFEAGIQNPNFSIDGPLSSKWFNVDFGGKGAIGKTMANQVFESLYNKSTKTWKPTEAAGVASEGEIPGKVCVYFNPDRSPKMERTAMLARKAKSVVEGMFPNKKVFIRKGDFRMSVDFEPCIQPIANDATHSQLKFKGTTFNDAQQADIKRAFAVKVEESNGGGEWL